MIFFQYFREMYENLHNSVDAFIWITLHADWTVALYFMCNLLEYFMDLYLWNCLLEYFMDLYLWTVFGNISTTLKLYWTLSCMFKRITARTWTLKEQLNCFSTVELIWWNYRLFHPRNMINLMPFSPTNKIEKSRSEEFRLVIEAISVFFFSPLTMTPTDIRVFPK